jgi:hypothetical protein
MTTQAKGQFEIKNWDEKPYNEVEGEAKLTHAVVTVAYTGDIEGEGRVEFLMTYADDGSASFVSQERVTGRIGNRAGSFVLQGNGTYAGSTARTEFHIVPGSGTGELRGLSGKGQYSAGEGMVADYTLDYSVG